MPTLRIILRSIVAVAAMLVPATVAQADSGTFSNASSITIPDSGPATPYPSPVTVSGLTGRISDMTVTVQGITHTAIGDVVMLLRAPSGDAILLYGGPGCGGNVSAINMAFADTGAATSGSCSTGTWRPDGGATALTGAGGTGNISKLARFRGQDPNGVWNLYVEDRYGGDVGTATGWALQVTTDTAGVVRIPAAGSDGVASAYPITIPAPPVPAGEVISGFSVTLTGLAHGNPADLDVLLVGPHGRAVPLMSDVCGTQDLAGVNLVFAESAGSSLGGGPCAAGTFTASDVGADDVWPAPAPAPTATALSVLDRTDPGAPWQVFVKDDTPLATGELTGASVSVTTTPARSLFFFSEVVTAPEGTTATLRLARLGSPSGPATVDYATVAGTAEAGSDFTPVSGTVTFARNELTRRIQIPITSDGIAEDEEHLTVRLSNPTDDAVIDGSDEARILIPSSAGPPAPAPAPSTPAPSEPAAPCAALRGTAKAACLRKQRAEKARKACIRRYRPGPRRTACLRTAARIAAVPAKR